MRVSNAGIFGQDEWDRLLFPWGCTDNRSHRLTCRSTHIVSAGDIIIDEVGSNLSLDII